MLVLHSTLSQIIRTPRSAIRTQGLRIPSSAFRIYEAADSVLCIGHSTFMPDVRYVKQLKSPARIVHGSENCLTFCIERTAGFASQRVRSPHVSKGLLSADGVVLSPHSTQLIPQSDTSANSLLPNANCFLGLTYAGTSLESDHYRDYAAEALAAKRSHERQIKHLARRSATQAMIEGMTDGSYQRYLKGE